MTNRRAFMMTSAGALLGGLNPPLAEAAVPVDAFERQRKVIEASVNRGLDYLLSQEDMETGTFPDGAYGINVLKLERGIDTYSYYFFSSADVHYS